MEKFLKIVLAAVVAGFIALAIWAFSQSNTKSEKVDYTKYNAYGIIEGDENNGNIGDQVRGNKDSKVVVLEYSDFECPGCAGAQSRINKIYEKYKDKVAFVSRSLKVHDHAKIAAQAATSASLQGKYWEMADKLFENQAEWSDETLTDEDRIDIFQGYFKAIAPEGNAEAFKRNINSEKVIKKVNFDNEIGSKIIEVSETPSFYINSEKFEIIDQHFEDDEDFINKFNAKIDEALKK
jgi:protein-disulfide isomerase